MMENSLLNLVPFDLAYVAIGIMGVELLLLLMVIVALVKCGGLKKKYKAFMGGKEAKSLEKIITDEVADIKELKEKDKQLDQKIDDKDNVINQKIDDNNKKIEEIIDANEKNTKEKIERLCNVVTGCYQKTAVVKYDALQMGGQVSFAYCLLNKNNDGVILNSIHTREGSYLYAKEIKNGSCEVLLGKEEQQALVKAMAIDISF